MDKELVVRRAGRCRSARSRRRPLWPCCDRPWRHVYRLEWLTRLPPRTGAWATWSGTWRTRSRLRRPSRRSDEEEVAEAREAEAREEEEDEDEEDEEEEEAADEVAGRPLA